MHVVILGGGQYAEYESKAEEWEGEMGVGEMQAGKQAARHSRLQVFRELC